MPKKSALTIWYLFAATTALLTIFTTRSFTGAAPPTIGTTLQPGNLNHLLNACRHFPQGQLDRILEVTAPARSPASTPTASEEFPESAQQILKNGSPSTTTKTLKDTGESCHEPRADE